MELYWKLLSHTNFFTFTPCILTQTPPPTTPYIFKTGSVLMHLRGNYPFCLVFLPHCMPASQHHRPISTYRCTEKETGMVRTGVLVSGICRPCSPLHGFSYLLNFLLCSGCFTNPKCRLLTSWEWDSAINLLCGAFTNSLDKSYWFYL